MKKEKFNNLLKELSTCQKCTNLKKQKQQRLCINKHIPKQRILQKHPINMDRLAKQTKLKNHYHRPRLGTIQRHEKTKRAIYKKSKCRKLEKTNRTRKK